MESVKRVSLFKNEKATLERVENFICKQSWLDVNLYGRLYNHNTVTESLELLHLDCAQERVKFREANEKFENGQGNWHCRICHSDLVLGTAIIFRKEVRNWRQNRPYLVHALGQSGF